MITNCINNCIKQLLLLFTTKTRQPTITYGEALSLWSAVTLSVTYALTSLLYTCGSCTLLQEAPYVQEYEQTIYEVMFVCVAVKRSHHYSEFLQLLRTEKWRSIHLLFPRLLLGFCFFHVVFYHRHMDRKVGQHQPVFEMQDEIRKQWQNQMGSQRLGHAWAVAALLLPISQKKKKNGRGSLCLIYSTRPMSAPMFLTVRGSKKNGKQERNANTRGEGRTGWRQIGQSHNLPISFSLSFFLSLFSLFCCMQNCR